MATWYVRGVALLLFGLALTMTAAGVTAAHDKTDKPTQVTVNDKDSEGKVKIAKGDTLVVRLPMQAGTGFTWMLAKVDKDKLKQVGKETTEKPEKPQVGGKVMQVFTFTAEAEGELEFHYRRPFEKDKAPARIYKLSVQVE